MLHVPPSERARAVPGDRHTLGSLLAGFSTSVLPQFWQFALIRRIICAAGRRTAHLPIPEQGLHLPQKPRLPWLVRREDGWVELLLHLNPWQGL